MLINFLSIILPAFSGDTISDVKVLLTSNNKQKTYEHVKAVALMSIKIAEQYDLDKSICELSGYLHDISAIIAPQDMLSNAIANGWHIDEA
ncbi:MAG: HDIG domain-containing protein [Clostridiales bacterium]|nr:HDIG domain-containing protein [Clostridiales bacterium]